MPSETNDKNGTRWYLGDLAPDDRHETLFSLRDTLLSLALFLRDGRGASSSFTFGSAENGSCCGGHVTTLTCQHRRAFRTTPNPRPPPRLHAFSITLRLRTRAHAKTAYVTPRRATLSITEKHMATNILTTAEESGTPNATIDASPPDIAQITDPAMSFQSRSRDRTAQLAEAIEHYHERATAERLFDPSGITTMSELYQLRDDPQINENLAQLDAEIQEVQALQKQLTTVQAKLGVWRARSRNLLCPIYMLPNELLGQIFTCSLPEGRELVEFTTAVSSVCRLWRDVAIRYRSMWKVFDLRWHAARELAWLSRSMDPKISVFADFPGPLGDDHNLSAVDFRGLFRHDGLFEHSHSWTSAEFSITSSSHLIPITSYISPNCSGLQSLTIMDGAANDNIEEYQVIDADLWTLTRYMPRLTELTLRSVYPINLYDTISRLRILRINSIGWRSSTAGSIRRWMDLMRQATSLEELEADWDRMGWRRHRPASLPSVARPLRLRDPYRETVDMARLKHLKIHCIDVRVSVHLFQHFRCPALESLEIEFGKMTFTSTGCDYSDLDISLHTFVSDKHHARYFV